MRIALSGISPPSQGSLQYKYNSKPLMRTFTGLPVQVRILSGKNSQLAS